MALEQSPAFQFYVKEWRSSRNVSRMTFAQRGMYLEMLLEQWENLSLPDNALECADLIGGTIEEWTSAWPVLRRNFTEIEGGRIQNQRLEKTRQEKRKFIKRATRGGKARAAVATRNGGKFATSLDTSQSPANEPATTLVSPPATSPADRQPSTSTASASSSASATARDRARVGGPIIGRNPHIDHAACNSTLTWCVPPNVHSKLADALSAKYGGDRDLAKDALQAWYPTVWAKLPEQFVMPDAFKFWQARFDAELASADTGAARKASEPRSTVPGADATAKYLERFQ